MILVICMAGLNTRFHDAGFDIPKYLLPWGNHVIIYEILQQLTKSQQFNRIILLANIRDHFFKSALQESVKSFSPEIYYINDTLGQAHTAAWAAHVVDTNDIFVIHNADTIVENRNFQQISNSLDTYDAFIDVFSAKSLDYCYITASGTNVTGINEKKYISPFASSGLYCFKTVKLYLENYTNALTKFNKEIFVSDVLASMINADLKISLNDITPDHITTVIGSPAEYAEEISKKNEHPKNKT